MAALEKEKKDNWDRYLRAAADLENARKRQKRELDDARLE
ncbi:MAG: nucleotide exchange factor GrpE, partial [Deltaproteobacteria bacterium]